MLPKPMILTLKLGIFSIDKFDHHCLWLNTCVGRKNYKYFFALLLLLCIFLMLQTASASYALYVTIDINMLYQGTSAQIASFSFLVIYLILLIIALGNVLHLFGFHIMLQIKGLTTYQYLVDAEREEIKRKRQKIKKKEHTNDGSSHPPESVKKEAGNTSSPSNAAPQAEPLEHAGVELGEVDEEQQSLTEQHDEHKVISAAPDLGDVINVDETVLVHNNDEESQMPQLMREIKPIQSVDDKIGRRSTNSEGSDHRSTSSQNRESDEEASPLQMTVETAALPASLELSNV
jgi:hypothetical protein